MASDAPLHTWEDDDIVIVGSSCHTDDPHRLSRCCINCGCGCRDIQHKQDTLSIKSKQAMSAIQTQFQKRPYPAVAQTRDDMSSYRTNDSFHMLFSDHEVGSLPSKPLVVAPSLDMLSRSPANRTEEQIARERIREFCDDPDNGSFPYQSCDTVSDVGQTEEMGMFAVADLSGSMQVNYQLDENQQSMLSSYASSFTPNLSASGLIIDVGAGLADVGRYSRKFSTCHHGSAANRCHICR